MAERSARPSNPGAGNSGITLYTWETVTENDTAEEIMINGTGPALLALQATGTLGGATLILQGSNDGTNWVTVADVQGSSDGLTSVGGAEYSTSFVYLRPSASGGSSQDVDFTLAFRG